MTGPFDYLINNTYGNLAVIPTLTAAPTGTECAGAPQGATGSIYSVTFGLNTVYADNYCRTPLSLTPSSPTQYGPSENCSGCPSAPNLFIYADGSGSGFAAVPCQNFPQLLTQFSPSPEPAFIVYDPANKACSNIPGSTPFIVDNNAALTNAIDPSMQCTVPDGFVCSGVQRSSQITIKCITLELPTTAAKNVCSQPSQKFASENCAGCLSASRL